jgi:hypothetical protein
MSCVFRLVSFVLTGRNHTVFIAAVAKKGFSSPFDSLRLRGVFGVSCGVSNRVSLAYTISEVINKPEIRILAKGNQVFRQ